MTTPSENALDQTIQWFNRVVLGLNLCPFAHNPAKLNAIRWVVVDYPSPNSLLESIAAEIEMLRASSEQALATTVLVAPTGFEEFDDYLDMLAFLNDWLDETGNHQDFQLASFHPLYQFDGLDVSDRANWTNRSPLPLFHIIREASITRVTEAGADTESIPERNIETIEKLPAKKMRELFPHFDE